MEYRGVYDDGVIRPSQPLDLPNGTEVEFHPVRGRNGSPPTPAAAPPPGAIGTMTPDELRAYRQRAAKGKSLSEIIAEQGVPPIRSLADLAIEGLESEDVDAFLRTVKEGRRSGRREP